jgi:DNA-binding GntR family transcriptional regulator
LTPGTRLVEASLAEELQISRTPVREALHKLELEGLVRPVGRRGVIVVGIDLDDVREIMGLREILESHAAGLAAHRVTATDVRSMESSLERAGQSIAAGDVEGLLRWNTRFHDTLIACSGSHRLIDIIARLRDHVIAYRLATLRVAGLPARSHQEHQALLDAVRRRDAEVAETLMRAHVRAKAEALLSALRADGRDTAALMRDPAPALRRGSA